MSPKKILNIHSSYIFAQVYKMFYIDFRKKSVLNVLLKRFLCSLEGA